jgi:prepilin-type N-terminal cleavage/methylation domain-containing protein
MKNGKRQGYSLIELVVVIAIMAVLAGLLLGAIQKVRNHANRATFSLYLFIITHL